MVAFEIARDGLRPLDGKGATISRRINKHRYVGDQGASRVIRAGALEGERKDLVIRDATTTVRPGQRRPAILRDCWKCSHTSTPHRFIRRSDAGDAKYKSLRPRLPRSNLISCWLSSRCTMM